MEKFLLLTREDVQGLQKSAAFAAAIREMMAWIEELAQSGNYLGGDALTDTGTYVTKDHVLSDGPFIESNEAVSGTVLLLAENIHQATAIAQNCPRVMRGEMAIEVRPLLSVHHA